MTGIVLERTSRKGDWTHPDGIPLDEIAVNSHHRGRVTNVGPFGVFVDFGAEKDGLLRVPVKVGRRLKRGVTLANVVVVSCDPGTGRVVLETDTATLVANGTLKQGTNQARSAPASSGSANLEDSTKISTRSPSRPRIWSHPGAVPLGDLLEGTVLDGCVTNVSIHGVFVDIGATKDARLSVPARVGRLFRVGDVIPHCVLETVDPERQRLTVTVSDVDTLVTGRPRKSQSSKGSVQAHINNPARTTVPRQTSRGTKSRPLSNVQVGSVVDGVVVRLADQMVYVNLGSTMQGVMHLPRTLVQQFLVGDEVRGMIVESVDTLRKQIHLILDDPELDEIGTSSVHSVNPMTAKATGSSKFNMHAAPAMAVPNEAETRILALEKENKALKAALEKVMRH